MIKRFIGLMLLALTVVCGGCGKDSGAPKLVMATNAAFPPYEYKEHGRIDGIDPAIVGLIAQRLGYELEIRDMEFGAVITAVQTGKADIAASGITITEERKKQVLFTNSYVSAAQMILVRNDSGITGEADFPGKSIGVQEGTTGDTYVNKHFKDKVRINRYKDPSSAVQALITNKIDLVVIDAEPAQVFVSKNPEIRQLPKPLTHEEYAFAINKNNPELLGKFNAELMKMKTSGELDDIIEHYRKINDERAGEPDFARGFWTRLEDSLYVNFVKDGRYKYLLNGFIVTLEITVLAVLMGIVIGFAVAVVRCTADQTGHLKWLDWLCRVYLTVIRGTPVVVQLLIIYFVIFSSINISQVLVAVIAFGINSGAYVAEIIRGGIMSVDRGQMEAGQSLGLTYNQTMRFVVLPQAFKNVLPALGNEFIVLLKETSVAGYIALQDLTKAGDIIRSQTYDAFLPLIAVALIYLAVVMCLSWLLGRLEKRLKKNE